MAYHEDSGDIAWSRASGAQTYSSAQLVKLLGEQQLVMHDNKALVSLKLADGSLLWEVANPSEFSVPMLQPRAVNDHQLLVSFEPELVLLDIQHADDKWSTTTSWKSNKLKAGFNDVVIHGDEIFGLDDGIMSSLDLKTGKRLWKRSRYGHGQLLDLGRLMLVMAESGDVAIWDLAATPPAELSHFKAIDGKTWNHPVVAHGRLYVRNGEEFACYQIAAN
jgi:outer membrane protein assembly factor BamB